MKDVNNHIKGDQQNLKALNWLEQFTKNIITHIKESLHSLINLKNECRPYIEFNLLQLIAFDSVWNDGQIGRGYNTRSLGLLSFVDKTLQVLIELSGR